MMPIMRRCPLPSMPSSIIRGAQERSKREQELPPYLSIIAHLLPISADHAMMSTNPCSLIRCAGTLIPEPVRWKQQYPFRR